MNVDMFRNNNRNTVLIQDEQNDMITELHRLYNAIRVRDARFQEHDTIFENTTFWIQPYYFGDTICTCGWQTTYMTTFGDTVPVHTPSCYQSKLREWEHRHDASVTIQRYREYCKLLCSKYDIPWNKGKGAALHCTCQYQERYREFCDTVVRKIGWHNEKTCIPIRDNFHFRPDNIGIQWYRQPLKSAYMNKPVDENAFREIISNCIDSLSGDYSLYSILMV